MLSISFFNRDLFMIRMYNVTAPVFRESVINIVHCDAYNFNFISDRKLCVKYVCFQTLTSKLCKLCPTVARSHLMYPTHILSTALMYSFVDLILFFILIKNVAFHQSFYVICTCYKSCAQCYLHHISFSITMNYMCIY